MSTNTYPQVAFPEQGSGLSEIMSEITGATASPIQNPCTPAQSSGYRYDADGLSETITNSLETLPSSGVLPHSWLYLRFVHAGFLPRHAGIAEFDDSWHDLWMSGLRRVAAIESCVICLEEKEVVQVCDNGHSLCVECLQSLVTNAYAADSVMVRHNEQSVSVPTCSMCRRTHNEYALGLFRAEEQRARSRGDYSALVARGRYNFALLSALNVPTIQAQLPNVVPQPPTYIAGPAPIYRLEFPNEVVLRQSYFLRELSRLSRLYVFWVPLRDNMNTLMSCVPRTYCALTRFFGANRGNVSMYDAERRFVMWWRDFELSRRPDVLEVLALFEMSRSPFGVYILEIEDDDGEPSDTVKVTTLYRGGYPGLGLWLFPDVGNNGSFRMLHAEPCCGDVNETWCVAQCPFFERMNGDARDVYNDLVVNIVSHSPVNREEPNEGLEADMREEIANLDWLHQLAPWCFRRRVTLSANPNYEYVDPVDYPRIATGDGPAGTQAVWEFTAPPSGVGVFDPDIPGVLAPVGSTRPPGGLEMFLRTPQGRDAFRRGTEHDNSIPVCGRCNRRGHYTNRCNADLMREAVSSSFTAPVQAYMATRYTRPGVVPPLVDITDGLRVIPEVANETPVSGPEPELLVVTDVMTQIEAQADTEVEVQGVSGPLEPQILESLLDEAGNEHDRREVALSLLRRAPSTVVHPPEQIQEPETHAPETEQAVEQPTQLVVEENNAVQVEEVVTMPLDVVEPMVPVVVPVVLTTEVFGETLEHAPLAPIVERGVFDDAVWVSQLPPPEHAMRMFWIQQPGFTAESGTYTGEKCSCALFGLKVCMHVMKALIKRRLVLYHGLSVPLYLLVFPSVYEIALPEARFGQRWESRKGELVFTRGDDVHSVRVAHPGMAYDTLGLGRTTLGEFTGFRPGNVLQRAFYGAAEKLMDVKTAYDCARGALIGLACHACNFTQTTVQALIIKMGGCGWAKMIMIFPMKIFGFLGITTIEALAVSVAAAMCVKLVCTVLIVKYLLQQSGVVQLFAAAVGGVLFSGVGIVKWLWTLPAAYVAVATPDWSVLNRQPTSAEALAMIELVPGDEEDLNAMFARAVNTRIHLSARELTGQVASMAMRLEDAPTPIMSRVTLAVTAAQHAASIERARRYPTAVGGREGRECKGCRVKAQGRMKYNLCARCLTLLPENGRQPEMTCENIDFVQGSTASGPLPLICLMSTPMAPPRTLVETRDGSSITTTFKVKDSFTADNCRVTKRAVGVGVLHPRHIPYVPPRGITSLVFGLLARTFSKLLEKPTPGVWKVIQENEQLIFPIECLGTVRPMGQEEWARSQERTEELAAAHVLVQKEGILPEDLIVGVFGKQQLAAGWDAMIANGIVITKRIEKHKPRIIYTPNDKIHARVGPHVKPFIKFLKNTLNVDYWITYCGCLKPKEMQKVLDKLVEKMDLKWWMFENDFSQFETTQGQECQRVLLDGYKNWWIEPDQEVLDILKELVAPRFRASCGGHRISGRLPPMTISGIDDTSARSTASNARVTGLSMLAARQGNDILHLNAGRAERDKCLLDIAGDDGVLGVEPVHGMKIEEFAKHVEHNIRSAGFSPKLKMIQQITQVVFLAQRPYWSVDQNGENGYYMWGPTLGRRLYKHHFVLDLIGDPYVWLGEVAQMESNCYGHVPLLADIAKRVLQIIGKGKTMRKSMRQRLEKLGLYADIREEHKRVYNKRTLTELSKMYDVEVSQFEDLIDEIGQIRTLPWSLGGDLVDRIMAYDDH